MNAVADDNVPLVRRSLASLDWRMWTAFPNL
jgi:hypothetical protein